MRRRITIAATAVGVAATIAIGFSVGALASSSSSSAPASSSETQTTPTTTTEEGMSLPYGATLVARSEVPKPSGVKTGARGTFKITLKHKHGKTTASWKLTFRNLTGKATAAHIHHAKPGKAGPVIVPLCGPCKSGQSGTIKLPEMDASLIEKGKTYVNVHTVKNPAGEIRGQIAKK